jgi:hypothetical protein
MKDTNQVENSMVIEILMQEPEVLVRMVENGRDT